MSKFDQTAMEDIKKTLMFENVVHDSYEQAFATSMGKALAQLCQNMKPERLVFAVPNVLFTIPLLNNVKLVCVDVIPNKIVSEKLVLPSWTNTGSLAPDDPILERFQRIVLVDFLLTSYDKITELTPENRYLFFASLTGKFFEPFFQAVGPVRPDKVDPETKLLRYCYLTQASASTRSILHSLTDWTQRVPPESLF